MTAIRQSTTNYAAYLGTLEKLFLEKLIIINYSYDYRYLLTLDIGNAFYIMIIADLRDLSGKWESC